MIHYLVPEHKSLDDIIYSLDKNEMILGRSDSHALIVKHENVSSNHCSFVREGDDDMFSVKDLDSVNGTYVNNSKIPPHTSIGLSFGDIITVGDIPLKYVRCIDEYMEQRNLATSQDKKFLVEKSIEIDPMAVTNVGHDVLSEQKKNTIKAVSTMIAGALAFLVFVFLIYYFLINL